LAATKPSPKPKRATPQDVVRVRWEKRNIALFGGGLGAVVLGFVLLSQGDVTLAPILLVLGYCVLIPLAFVL
jgi:hypothetical protein